MLKRQIELERNQTILGSEKFIRDFEKAKANGSFGSTKTAITVITTNIESFVDTIKRYKDDYSKGKAVRSTLAAEVISRLDVYTVAYVAMKVILNSLWSQEFSIQSLQKCIGQALEDECKMQQFKKYNKDYYKKSLADLQSRNAKGNRVKIVINYVFEHLLDFHIDKWTATEKIQVGMVLIRLFIEATNLAEFHNYYERGKHIIKVIPSPYLVELVDNLNEKLELLQPNALPMVCKPKEWSGIFDGGYISPYLKRNKLIKNNSKSYLRKLNTHDMPYVYNAINHLQNTEWAINLKVLEVATKLWEEGKAIAELPNREDEAIPPYPYPDKPKEKLTKKEADIVKSWKNEAYAIHKRNIQKRSVRILVSQILRIAIEFKDYERIYFPHQMDFRGRLYPIPVLLQPQGSDLAKGLLRFAKGKKVVSDTSAIRWLKIHGANVFGYDKESYDKRIEWVDEREEEIKAIAQNPLENRLWAEADKPFQFLAWCFEYNEFLLNPENFETHIPIQLDGTCNGLQHYSALLRDEVGGKAVNLINSEKPSDIYSEVANKLEEKLKEIKNDSKRNLYNSGLNNDGNINSVSDNVVRSYATHWLELGINRKLTKRPVMVLPYGGSEYSCREFIEDYLKENYSQSYIWQKFNIGKSPSDCLFKITLWLSKYLWEAIEETLIAATSGMDYIRKVTKIVCSKNSYLEWKTPIGLIARQKYYARKKKMIRTELYGSILKSTANLDTEKPDNQRQINGICPNFIHSLDASCLMLYLNKCKEAEIDSFMTVHDCYGTYATDTDKSAKLLREAFVEIYQQPILENFVSDIIKETPELAEELPEQPKMGNLNITDVLNSKYFFN